MNPSTRNRVFALDLHPLSFGYAMFEGPEELIEWGIKNFRHGVNERLVAVVPSAVKPLAGFPRIHVAECLRQIAVPHLRCKALRDDIHQCLVDDLIFNGEDGIRTEDS